MRCASRQRRAGALLGRPLSAAGATLAADACTRGEGLATLLDGSSFYATADEATLTIDRSDGHFTVAKNGDATFQTGTISVEASEDGNTLTVTVTLTQGENSLTMSGNLRKDSDDDPLVIVSLKLDGGYALMQELDSATWGALRSIEDRGAAAKAALFVLSHFTTLFGRLQTPPPSGQPAPDPPLSLVRTTAVLAVTLGCGCTPWSCPAFGAFGPPTTTNTGGTLSCGWCQSRTCTRTCTIFGLPCGWPVCQTSMTQCQCVHDNPTSGPCPTTPPPEINPGPVFSGPCP